MKVLILNEYSLERAVEAAASGDLPPHLAFGIDRFPSRGVTVDVLPFRRFDRLKRLTRRRTGDLDQQIHAAWRASRYDVVLVASQYDGMLLSILRRLRLLRSRLVIIMHNPMRAGLRRRWLVRLLFGGNDRLLCLNGCVLDELAGAGIPRRRLRQINWGVDVSFYERITTPSPETPEPSFVSAGKTKRDYEVLAEAFAGTGYELDIYTSLVSAPKRAAPEVRVHHGGLHPKQARALTFAELTERYQRAWAVLIPISAAALGTGSGLSSLVEALALGRPVVITRNQGIALDVEREGVGLVVEAGDAAGWRRAVTWMAEHPDERLAMARRARTLAESSWSLDRFVDDLTRHLREVDGRAVETVSPA